MADTVVAAGLEFVLAALSIVTLGVRVQLPLIK